jgi:hypothetical protein
MKNILLIIIFQRLKHVQYRSVLCFDVMFWWVSNIHYGYKCATLTTWFWFFTPMLDVSLGRPKRTTLYREIIAVCSDSHTKYVTGLHTVGKTRRLLWYSTYYMTYALHNEFTVPPWFWTSIQGSRIAPDLIQEWRNNRLCNPRSGHARLEECYTARYHAVWLYTSDHFSSCTLKRVKLLSRGPVKTEVLHWWHNA